MRNILLSLFLIQTYSYAASLDIKSFLTRVKKSYPEVKIQEAKLQKLNEKIRKQSGAFDTSLSLSQKKYTEGYYDMELNELSIARKLPLANSKIEIGRRQSAGQVPVYYSEFETDRRGENFIRLQTSLLRYRAIDPQRFDLAMAKNEADIQKQKQSLKVMDTLIKANSYYWKWVVAFEKLQVYQELVELNKKRFNAIKGRVAKKDLARIYLTESEQYLLTFQSDLAEVKAKYNQLLSYLKMYDSKIDDSYVPLYSLPTKEITSYSKKTANLSQRPEIKILNTLLEANEFSRLNAQQKLQPKLDFSVEHFNSRLDADEQYGDETMVGIKIEIPIERDLGKGAIAETKAEKMVIDSQFDLLRRELTTQYDNLNYQINGLISSINFTAKELENTKVLQQAEWKKFKAGASDFFLINTRDINYAKSRIKLIEKYSQYQITKYNLELFIKPIEL